MPPKIATCRSQATSSAAMAPIATFASLIILLALIARPYQQVEANQLTRKSIVFDLKTPKVFYCPQEKPSDDLDKMIVKAQSLDKLCEFEGKQKPKGARSDCYNDVDETEFGCDEKRRFMIRLDLASETGLDSGTEGIDDLDYIRASGSKKKTLPKEKKRN